MEDILEDKRALRYEPEYYQDMNKMRELDEEIDDIHNQIHALEEKWEEAMLESEENKQTNCPTNMPSICFAKARITKRMII